MNYLSTHSPFTPAEKAAKQSLFKDFGCLFFRFISGNNSIYFLEINSRFTTPYVGLSKIAKFNIGKSIINLLDNKIDISKLYKEGFGSNKFDKMVKFKKNGNNLDIEVL